MSGSARMALLAAAVATLCPAPGAQVLVPEARQLQAPPPDSFLARGILTDGSRRGERLLYPFSVSADSVVVVFDPNGDSLQLPLGVVQTLGMVADDVEGAPLPISETAWSFQDGRVELLLRRDVHLRTVLLGGALVVLGFLLIIVWLARRLQQERALRRTVESVGWRLNEGREAERRRLAQDLHDGPIQDIIVARRNIEGALDEPLDRESDRPTLVRLASAEQSLSGAVEGLRALTESLRPPSLAPFGLPAALGDLADRLRADHPGLEVVVHADPDAAVPDDSRLALFRIAQEAATNAAKHGPAATISLALNRTPGGVALSVRDDGPGFVFAGFEEYGRDRHYGLLGMSERARAAGGVLAIETAPGAGTSIRVSLLDAPPESRFPRRRRPS